MKFWKIKLKGYDLYYRPNASSFEKSNLSESGKAYNKKPTTKQICSITYINKRLADKHNVPHVQANPKYYGFRLGFKPEWEIEEFTTTPL